MRYWKDGINDEPIMVSRPPIHPGEMLREEFMPDFDLSVATLASKLGVSRQTVNEVVHERRDLSFDLCLRLSRLFGTSPELWMNMQRDVDMWNALSRDRDSLEAIEPLSVMTA